MALLKQALCRVYEGHLPVELITILLDMVG